MSHATQLAKHVQLRGKKEKIKKPFKKYRRIARGAPVGLVSHLLRDIAAGKQLIIDPIHTNTHTHTKHKFGECMFLVV